MVSVGDELVGGGHLWSHQIFSAPKINPQSWQEHLEAQTVLATELQRRKQLGYIHSAEA